MRYRVNSMDVVHEEIDGEVVAIDLGRGSYFTFSGGATDLWAMLEGGATREEMEAAYAGAPDPGSLSEEVGALLDRMTLESLILTEEMTETNAGPAPGSVDYRPLVFEKYDDLQDYFMLDPIHEVGKAGWPRPADG